jgi:RNA-binding protein Nova
MKILIPNSTAGMIIGKAGAFIRQIKEESGAFIQLSQKAKDGSAVLSERVVTVLGEPEQNRRAMEMILNKIEIDPQSGACLNIRYKI